VVQVALALVLLVGSGLMLRTFQALRNVQPGFARAEEIQLLHVSIPEGQVKEPERVMRMQQAMLDKLAAIPGVTGVALGNAAPMEGFNWNDLLYAEDKTYAVGQIPPVRRFRMVTPGYMKTLGIRMLAGRDFEWVDLYEKRHVTIVSENLAKELWGGPAAAIGKKVRAAPTNPWREVIGVVGNVYDNGVQVAAPSFAYFPVMMDEFEMDPILITRGGTFLIRSTRAGTESFLTEVRQAIWAVNPNLPVFLVRTLKDIYDQSMARTSFTMVLLGIAGGMALLLGIVGIYGVIAYSVSQRTREIGIRMALGAQPAGLQGMFVKNGLVLAGIGAALGLAAAVALTRLMTSLLFGISALDPVTYAGVAVVLIGAAAGASYFPARRATAVDPVVALRAE
jgi:putative ABC transport system permease protein